MKRLTDQQVQQRLDAIRGKRETKEAAGHQLKRALSMPAATGRMIAEAAAQVASMDLGIPEINVVEISPDEHRGLNGFVSPSEKGNTVHVRIAGLCKRCIAAAVFHEAEHLHQIKNGIDLLVGDGNREATAESYALWIFRKLHLDDHCSCGSKEGSLTLTNVAH